MLAPIAIWRFLRPLLPYIAIGLAVLGFYLWVTGMQHTIAKQADDLRATKAALANETAARERDVSALTTLSAGLTKAATETRADAKVLSETINAANPTPSSPALAAFLAGLRTNDAPKGAPAPSGSRR